MAFLNYCCFFFIQPLKRAHTISPKKSQCRLYKLFKSNVYFWGGKDPIFPHHQTLKPIRQHSWNSEEAEEEVAAGWTTVSSCFFLQYIPCTRSGFFVNSVVLLFYRTRDCVTVAFCTSVKVGWKKNVVILSKAVIGYSHKCTHGHSWTCV